MTHALNCFGYCVQVNYLRTLESRLEKVTTSVLMICIFFWGGGQQREASDDNGWGSARTRRRNDSVNCGCAKRFSRVFGCYGLCF